LEGKYINSIICGSFQELNAMYNLAAEIEIGQPHVLQNIIRESYNHSYLLLSYLFTNTFPHTFLFTHQLSHPEESAEPIYQNQGQILALEQEREGEEPIYQNLPLLQKLSYSQ
jgi:hypothetical protein